MARNEGTEMFCSKMEEHNSYVMKSLQEQLVEGKNCDLEIRLRNSKIYIHKCLVDVFFTKIGCDIENDMFYVDMKEFSQGMVNPLIDMMYHGELSVPLKNICDVQRVASFVGFKQAQELMNQYADNLTASIGLSQSTEVDGFVIKSEPPDDEMSDSGMINKPGYIVRIDEPTPSPKENSPDPEPARNIYEVYTLKPGERMATPKFSEDIDFSSLVREREKDKTSVLVTDSPYLAVSRIQKQNQSVVSEPSAASSKPSNDSKRSKRASLRTRSSTQVEAVAKTGTRREAVAKIGTRKKAVAKTGTQKKAVAKTGTRTEAVDEVSKDNLNKVQDKELMYKLSQKIDKNIANRSISVQHVNSPNIKPSRAQYDGSNMKNFDTAAVNRMLQTNLVSELAQKAKPKKTPFGTVKELSIKAALIKNKGKTNSEPDMNADKAIGTENIKTEPEDESSEEEGIVLPRQQRKRKVAETVMSYCSDSSESDSEIGEYLGRRKGKMKYFPPAGIVPQGCNSSYALSCFSKTRSVTETITNSRGDVMVIRKEIPVRRTIFNPKPGEQGVAAVVVCHPTKPVIKF